MKKLMVLAAVAAMAMGAKAEWVWESGAVLDIYPGLYDKENYMDYNNLYVMLESDFNSWQTTDGTLAGLGDRCWASGIAADLEDGDMELRWTNGTVEHATLEYGTFTKSPVNEDGKIVFPYDMTQQNNTFMVLMSNGSEYYLATGDFNGDVFTGNEFLFPKGVSAAETSPTSFSATPAPEPTSGLLLLLGVAGLALKRKRA